MVIAIDGPAGSGKSSTARKVAQQLGMLFLDTGAMYRAITLKALRTGIAASQEGDLESLVNSSTIEFRGDVPDIRVFLDGEDVSDAIRSDEVTRHVSDYCAPRVVRTALVEQQRRIASGHNVVAEGRDIGTVVFPGAEYKFYMVASVEERARRRQKDFERLGVSKSIAELVSDITERDRKDSTRGNSPLCRAEDAVEIDTTSLDFDDQVKTIVARVRGAA